MYYVLPTLIGLPIGILLGILPSLIEQRCLKNDLSNFIKLLKSK